MNEGLHFVAADSRNLIGSESFHYFCHGIRQLLEVRRRFVVAAEHPQCQRMRL